MSFVEVSPESDFPIQNLPYGVFSTDSRSKRIGVAIGDLILDLLVVAGEGFFADEVNQALKQNQLNEFMALKKDTWSATRKTITDLLSANGDGKLRDNADLRKNAFVKQSEATMHLPARIGDYTDFYSSRYHATNVGIMFRGKDNALQPNWLHLPVGYHGRASSVVSSGTDIRRPHGQLGPAQAGDLPTWGTCRLFDFELEMAFFVGGPTNKLGDRVKIEDADDRLFGLVVMNDWSARDIQKWEYVPLGPFNGKNFGTTISPWVVTMEALEPFRVAGEPQVDPEPLAYLKEEKTEGAYDINLSVSIQGESADKAERIAATNARHLYWSFKQQLVHHSSTGCPMTAGDLCGSGTISGPDEGSYGSMLEISWKGTKVKKLADGTERKFLKDGDTVSMRGFCKKDGPDGYRIGFGDCNGKVLPAHPE